MDLGEKTYVKQRLSAHITRTNDRIYTKRTIPSPPKKDTTLDDICYKAYNVLCEFTKMPPIQNIIKTNEKTIS